MKTADEWLAESTENNAREVLNHARSTLVRALQELDAYIKAFDAAETPAQKAEVLNWTLNHLATYIAPNLRLDMIASAQAAFSRLMK